MMEFFIKLSAYIQNLNSQDFKKHFFAFVLGVFVCAGLLIYYIHGQKASLIVRVKQMHKMAQQVQTIIADNRRMVIEEQRLKEILDQNKNFTIKGYFEQFCREQGLTPEPGWDTTTEPVSDKFDEIILPANFKNLTSEKFVRVLEELGKKNIVYIKEMAIHNDGSGKISCMVTMATKRYKYVLE